MLNRDNPVFFSSHPSFSSSSLSDIPSLSSFSGGVVDDFSKMQNGVKGVYKRLFVNFYNFFFKLKDFDNLFIIYNIKDRLSSAIPVISISDFLILAKLLYISCGGKYVVDSPRMGVKRYDYASLDRLKKCGLIKRVGKDPKTPYVIKEYRTNSFILLTPEGISFYNNIVKQLYKHAQTDLHDYLKST